MQQTRYLNPYLKYNGSKTKLAPIIAELYWQFFNEHTFVDLFCGSASVAFAVNSPKTALFDGNHDIVNIHRQARNGILYPLDLGDTLETFREEFLALREEFNGNEWEKYSRIRAIAYYTLIMHGFQGLCRGSSATKYNVPPAESGKGSVPKISTAMKKSLTENPGHMKSWVIDEFAFREKGDLETLVYSIDTPFIYIDPPYHEVHQKGKNVGKTKASQSYYGEPFDWVQQADLAEFAGESKAPAILSNNQTEQIVDLYKEKGLTVYSTFRPNTISCKASTRSKKKLEVFAVNNALLEKEGTGDFLGEAFGSPL